MKTNTGNVSPLFLESSYPLNKASLMEHLRGQKNFNLKEETGTHLVMAMTLVLSENVKECPITLHFHEIAPNALQFLGFKLVDKRKAKSSQTLIDLYASIDNCFEPHLFEANPTADNSIGEIFIRHGQIEKDVLGSDSRPSIIYPIQKKAVESLFILHDREASKREFYFFEGAIYLKLAGLDYRQRPYLLDEDGTYYAHLIQWDGVSRAPFFMPPYGQKAFDWNLAFSDDQLDFVQLLTVMNEPLTTRHLTFKPSNPHNKREYRSLEVMSDRLLQTEPMATFNEGDLAFVTLQQGQEPTLMKVLSALENGYYDLLTEGNSFTGPDTRLFKTANPVLASRMTLATDLPVNQHVGKYLVLSKRDNELVAQVEEECLHYYFVKETNVNGQECLSPIHKTAITQLFDTKEAGEQFLQTLQEENETKLQSLLQTGATPTHQALKVLIEQEPNPSNQTRFSKLALRYLSKDNSSTSAAQVLKQVLTALELANPNVSNA